MAFEIPGFSFSLPAAANYSTGAGQFRFVDVDSSGNAVASTAAGRAIGVRQNRPLQNEATTIVSTGIVMVEAAAVIARGAAVEAATGGKATTLASGTSLGIALEAAAGDGSIFACLLNLTTAGTPTTVNNPTVITLPISLAAITAAGDVVTNYVPGFAGTISKVVFVVTTPVTTGSKAATLNLEIGTTNLTGGVVALTSANCTPLGATVAGTAVTANNVFTNTDSISVEAASVTAFTEGAGMLLITVS